MARVSSLYIRLALVTVACGTLVYIISFNSVNPFSEYAVSAFARYSRNPTNDRISYDLTSPPAHTCAATVTRLQQQLIAAYAPILKGISYVNLWGYLGESMWELLARGVCVSIGLIHFRDREQGRCRDLVSSADSAQHVWYRDNGGVSVSRKKCL